MEGYRSIYSCSSGPDLEKLFNEIIQFQWRISYMHLS